MVLDDSRRLGGVDLLAAGPPCKGFSQLRNGHHDGRNGHNRVLAAMPDYVALLRPRMVLIENVPDLIRHGDGRTLRQLIERLEHPARGLRYSVTCSVYDAALFGTPQARRRLLIWGVRNGDGASCSPEMGPDLTTLYALVRHNGVVPPSFKSFYDSLLDPDSLMLTSSSQALSDLPQLAPGAPETPRSYASGPKTAFQRWVRAGAPSLLCDTQTPAVNTRRWSA